MQVPVTLQIPTQTSKFNCLMLFTNITVFEDEQLQNYDCSLTSPLKIADVDGMNGRDLKFTYELGNKPGFKFDWME